MTTGTHHFTGFKKALAYYKPYGHDKKSLERKIQNGEIKLGPPPIKNGQKLLIIKFEGRYAIEG